MPQPAVQDPAWHTCPLVQVLGNASLMPVQAVALVEGVHCWQLPLVALAAK